MSLKVTMLGTGVGIPQPGRSQAAVLVENDQNLLLDCGAGTSCVWTRWESTWKRLTLWCFRTFIWTMSQICWPWPMPAI